MKCVLGLILSLLSLNVVAEAIPFPSCTVNNQPVRYVSSPTHYDNSYTGYKYIASADIIDGQPVIDYNPTLLSTTPKEWNLQVMLHECGHVKLMHMYKPRHVSQEYEADCYSADILRKEYGYKEEEFDIILKTMKEFLPYDRITAFKSCLNR